VYTIIEASDGVLQIDNVPLEMVIIVARMVEFKDLGGKYTFELDDTTGKITIQTLKKEPTVDVRNNMYVRCMISIKPFKNSKSYHCSRYSEVTDFDEVGYHLMNSILARK